MTIFKSKDGTLYAGDMQPGDTVATQEEIDALNVQAAESKRKFMYSTVADVLLARVLRGSASAVEYVSTVAQIKFDNRTQDDLYKEYNQLYNEVAAKWNRAQPSLKVPLKT